MEGRLTHTHTHTHTQTQWLSYQNNRLTHTQTHTVKFIPKLNLSHTTDGRYTHVHTHTQKCATSLTQGSFAKNHTSNNQVTCPLATFHCSTIILPSSSGLITSTTTTKKKEKQYIHMNILIRFTSPLTTPNSWKSSLKRGKWLTYFTSQHEQKCSKSMVNLSVVQPSSNWIHADMGLKPEC